MVVLDPATREVLALVGGYDFHSGGFDRSRLRATGSRARRSSRSIYAAAIEVEEDHRRRRSSTTRPRSMRCGSRRTTRRRVPRPGARARPRWRSRSTRSPIKVLSHVGLPDARAVATRFGHHAPPIEPTSGLALALGVDEVTPLELANAYATFAERAACARPADAGARRRRREDRSRQPLEPATHARGRLRHDVAHAQRDRRGHGARRRRQAAPPGRRQDRHDQRSDATPGSSASRPICWPRCGSASTTASCSAAARRARRPRCPSGLDFMTKALVGRPTKDFVPPPGVVIQRIDKATGLLRRAWPGQQHHRRGLPATAPRRPSRRRSPARSPAPTSCCSTSSSGGHPLPAPLAIGALPLQRGRARSST